MVTILHHKTSFVTKKIISPEDQDLFRQTVGEVRIVKSDKALLKANPPPKPYPKPKTHSLDESIEEDALVDIDPVHHEESLIYTAPGIPHKVLAKLRKGFFGIQAELDLHGLTRDAAKRELSVFLARSQGAGFRCVHIIHGKGYGSADNYPVLKNNLNSWLRQHSAVQAFCSAPQHQGGAGAVYVLLKWL
jgi:DNA-nicking Smr family endonuclease